MRFEEKAKGSEERNSGGLTSPRSVGAHRERTPRQAFMHLTRCERCRAPDLYGRFRITGVPTAAATGTRQTRANEPNWRQGLRNCPHEAEAHEVVPTGRRVPVAIRGAAVARDAAPTAAADDAAGPAGSAFRIHRLLVCRVRRTVPVLAPFRHVPAHVIEAPGVRPSGPHGLCLPPGVP